jgi:hypothetical protein
LGPDIGCVRILLADLQAETHDQRPHISEQISAAMTMISTISWLTMKAIGS